MRCNRNTRRLLLTGDRSALALVMPGGACPERSRRNRAYSLKNILQGSRFYAKGLCVYCVIWQKALI